MKGFEANQRVRVKKENASPNRRVPDYVRGRTGVIVKVHGAVPNYEHDHPDNWGPLYSVLFDGISPNEKIVVDLHEPWLELYE